MEIVRTRRAIATQLRRFVKEKPVDKEKVLALAKKYGELDGKISYLYAMAFAEVAQTLRDDQKKALLKLRKLDAKYSCKGAYLYSRPIPMPEIPNTDFLFASPTPTKPTSAGSIPAQTNAPGSFVLRSPEVVEGGPLPKEFKRSGSQEIHVHGLRPVGSAAD